MRPLRCAIALALLAQLSLALYTSGVPIGVFQGRTDTTTPAALAGAGFTNVTVIDINSIDTTELTQFDVLVYAPDVGMDPDMYAKLSSASMFNRVARLLHQGKINVLAMAQPYQHTYYFLPFYQCTYPCSGRDRYPWSIDTVAEPYDPFWRYPNNLTQSDLMTIGTTVPHYIVHASWNSYMDGRVLAAHSSSVYPVLAEMRWGVGKIISSTFDNGCASAGCATQYRKLLQNSIAYLTSVDISAPVRASMDGANITVTVSSGQADRVRLQLPKWINADQTDKMLSGNQATFALTATYPGLYVIKAETFVGSSLNRTGEAWVQIGFTSTNVAPRIALIEARTSSSTEEGLDMMGLAYTAFDSTNIYPINLSAYDLVIVDAEIAYRGDAALRTALISMKTNITNWVTAGGKLLIFGQNTPFQEFAPITTTLYGSPSRSASWPFVIIDPYHQIHSYPHPFTNTEYSYVSNLLEHWLFQGSTGIEGDHPFSHDSAQNYQDIGIKKVGNGVVIGTVFVPWWYYHDRPGITEKQHDYQIQFIDNLFAVLNLNFTGYQKDWFAYNVRAIRCGSMMSNASVTVYLPGTTTVVDTAAGDASGNAIVHLNYGKYDVKIALQDGTFKTFYNQVFN